MTFGPDGNLYVASANFFTDGNVSVCIGDYPPGAVLKFEGPSGPNPGAFLGTFIAGGSNGLANPEAVLFGPDGDLYVSSCQESGQDGALFKAENGTSLVLRYDGTTGDFLGTFVTPDSGGLRCPISMTFTETDSVTLNYDGATTNTALTSATTATQPQPAAAMPATSGTTLPIASAHPAGSGSDPSATSLALWLSRIPAAPVEIGNGALSFVPTPLLPPSLTSNLPKADSSQSGQTAEAASDHVFADLGGGLSFARHVEDLAQIGESSDAMTPAKAQG